MLDIGRFLGLNNRIVKLFEVKNQKTPNPNLSAIGV